MAAQGPPCRIAVVTGACCGVGFATARASSRLAPAWRSSRGEALANTLPLARRGEPSAVAGLAVLLISEAPRLCFA